jgi:NAD(P)-dependent dehydrogenase (short-subunit alcohol dehydrogenase family)
MMTESLAGKTIWITGGAGYLGAEVTTALDRAGARTVCIELAGRAAQLIAGRKLKQTIAVDVPPDGARREFWKSLADQHGLPDGVAHLSYASSAGKHLTELTSADLDRTFTNAMTGTFELCQEIAVPMAKRGSGCFVFFASMYGMVPPDFRIYRAPLVPNPIDYGMSKAGIIQLSKYFAATYGRNNVRFNCISPGPFPNPTVQATQPAFKQELDAKTMLGRVGTAPEIVGPTLFLLSDAASYITGHTLVVDGGWTAW